jgi:hypothetical protein
VRKRGENRNEVSKLLRFNVNRWRLTGVVDGHPDGLDLHFKLMRSSDMNKLLATLIAGLFAAGAFAQAPAAAPAAAPAPAKMETKAEAKAEAKAEKKEHKHHHKHEHKHEKMDKAEGKK